MQNEKCVFLLIKNTIRINFRFDSEEQISTKKSAQEKIKNQLTFHCRMRNFKNKLLAKSAFLMSNEIEFNLTKDVDIEIEDAKAKRLTNYEIFLMVLAETIGTAMLVFFGCMGTIWWDQNPPQLPIPQINFGLTVMFIIHIFGHISNALINPAVTIAAVVLQMITWQVSFARNLIRKLH